MISLPWPSPLLAGHNKGHWRKRSAAVANHRLWAKAATLEAKVVAPATGDIIVRVTFNPPHRRGDRVNYAILAKPYFDGIADALKVNDSRFLPEYVFGEVVPLGRITVEIIYNNTTA